MSRLTPESLERSRAAADIVEVVSAHTELRRRGARTCFHHRDVDASPSQVDGKGKSDRTRAHNQDSSFAIGVVHRIDYSSMAPEALTIVAQRSISLFT